MTLAKRHIRPLLISLVALTLTAGVAFASKPAAPGTGRATGAEAGAGTLPVAANADENAETDESAETRQNVDEQPDSGSPDVSEDSATNCLADPTLLTLEARAALSHGAIVCWAAHQATPDGYANHGAFVSEIARRNHGADASAKGAAKAAAKSANSGAAGSSDTP